ncbi:MAG: KH domain-containing protein, partial [Deltaproteobacteria bacterium]|nr:KH domain-containing protein [Deltaproteobacteria bacterium]
PLFPDDELTDRPSRFFAAEIVRETAFYLLREEIPYAVAVSIEHWIEEQDRLRIEARIIVEEPSQKKIVVGKGGSMIKRIGTESRIRIQEFLGRRLHLGLQVTVRKSWSDDPSLLERLIETP